MPVTTTCYHLIWRIQRCAEDLREPDARRNDFRTAVADELESIATYLGVALAYAPGKEPDESLAPSEREQWRGEVNALNSAFDTLNTENARLRAIERWAREYIAHEDSPMCDVNDQTHALQQIRAALVATAPHNPTEPR